MMPHYLWGNPKWDEIYYSSYPGFFTEIHFSEIQMYYNNRIRNCNS